ncbi:LysR family transcriptional regulator [Rhizobium terrae]|uniref:LysR family transcriptional regulator n=1 Tax=Rhizobium terrae TaxID=2171756 RepID=UPI000E3B7B0A|nr:LysR family transcriptional regulator [Rhizobium terrae]
MRHLDNESLHCFLEAVRHGSISSASRSLGLAQPALTRRIQLLEEHFGDRLLSRHRRGIELTETGAIVAKRGEEILRMSQELADEVRSMVGRPAGLVRFGFPPSVGMLFVGRILAECVSRFNDVKLHLVENVSPAVREALIDNRLDMAIMSCRSGHESLRCVPLFHEQLWLFAAPDLWTLPPGSVSVDALQELPVMLASFLMQHLENKVPLRVMAAVDALPLAREALFERAGYGIFPYSALEREFKRGELYGAPISGLTVSRGLFFRKDRTTSNAMRLVEDLVKARVSMLISERNDMFQEVLGDDYIV